uniref:Cobalt-zinc-cadmium resistance protein CzcA n=1 Tax=Angiostrongylus cantonensis TaxID=6313 RepID=A0A0K0CW16_ANGCA
MAEVAERYVEQIQTTVETMRRRVLAYYDGVFFIGNKLITAAERARDVAEPIAYEVKDYIATATSQSEPVSQVDKDTKNNIVEMYLGISVLMLGISSGELAGAFVFPPVLEYIFDLYVEVIVLFLIPTYVYLNIRKNAGLY